MKNKSFCDKLLLTFTALALLCGGVGLSLFPAPAYSERENRTLSAFPRPTLATLRNGTLCEGLDSYATERFPGRGIWRALYAGGELALGKREAHGVILCRDGSLCRRISVDGAAFSRNLTAIKRLQDTLPIPLVLAVAPRRIDARTEVLPTLYDTAREQRVWGQLPLGCVTFPDCKEEAQWFRTDHHWTAEGAYHAYERLGAVLGYTPIPASEFTRCTVSSSFLGTSEAAAGIPGIAPEEIALYLLGNEERYEVIRDGRPASFPGLYDTGKLSARDQYAVFLGGNCGTLEISLGRGDTRPLLFLIKDSFANAMLPFLAQHYRICAVDPRYSKKPLAASAEGADICLVLCGMQTLSGGRFLDPYAI